LSGDSPEVIQLRNWVRERESHNSTYGPWRTEAEAEDYLTDFLRDTGLFCIYRQVRGWPMTQPHFRDHPASSASLRADVLLVPTVRLIDQGWDGGAVLIEVKRSDVKIGPGLGQLLDYMGTVWRVDGGIGVVPTFGFLFPALRQDSALASVMAQEHIGTATIRKGNRYVGTTVIREERLELCCGESRVLTVWRHGKLDFGTTNFGRKTGSR
jgi:hypothetical protein